jgi:hypothetical protein
VASLSGYVSQLRIGGEKLRILKPWKGKVSADLVNSRQMPQISLENPFRSRTDPGIEPHDPPFANAGGRFSVQPVFTTPNQGYTDA